MRCALQSIATCVTCVRFCGRHMVVAFALRAAANVRLLTPVMIGAKELVQNTLYLLPRHPRSTTSRRLRPWRLQSVSRVASVIKVPTLKRILTVSLTSGYGVPIGTAELSERFVQRVCVLR